MLALQHRFVIAASFLTLAAGSARAQGAMPSRDPHDSITVTRLSFPGATLVSPDDFRRLLFTRGSTCRLPFLIPLCKLTPTQLFTDRRRTTSAALGEDITKLRVHFWQRGFRDAQVDTVLTPTPRGAAVAFRIIEGEATRVGSLVVTLRAPVLTAKEISDAVTLVEGQPLDLVALDSTLTRLKAAVWNKGYGDVRIDTSVPRPDASHRVPVRIDVDPRWLTRVAHVEFQGNRYLDDATLRRGVLLQPGTLYTRDAVLESQKRLFESPAIARALAITPAAGDSLKTITMAITETPERQASVTLGFSTIEFGQAAAELRLNDLGAGRWLSLRGAAGNLFGEQLNGRAIFQQALPTDHAGDPDGFLAPTYQASLTLTQPWIGSARTSAAFTAFAGRRAIANVVVDDDAGATIGVRHELAPRTPIGINYRLETSRVQGSAVYFCASYGICDSATRDALTKWQRLAPVGLSAWVDRADDLEVPTRGYTGVVDAEHASSSTGSNFTHTRISADASVYRALGEQRSESGAPVLPMMLALHGRAGYVRAGSGVSVLHPRARFYAGGMQSVRGFAENELGPQVLQVQRVSLLASGCSDATIANGQCDPTAVPNDQLFARPIGGSSLIEASAELRIPLAKALGGVLFIDGAYVGAGGLVSAAKSRAAITPGGGFRYRSPLGVLRLDFGLRPVGARSLPVVVAIVDASGDNRVVQLTREKSYSPIAPSTGTLHSIARRIVVHFAMGQAF